MTQHHLPGRDCTVMEVLQHRPPNPPAITNSAWAAQRMVDFRRMTKPSGSNLALRELKDSNVERSSAPRSSFILEEREFRRKPRVEGALDQVVFSRWTLEDVQRPIELVSDPKSLDDSHIITFALKPTDAEIEYGGREFFRGHVPRQNLLMTGPHQGIRTIQKAPFDGIRMYLPQALLAECFEETHKRPAPALTTLTDPSMMADATIAKLLLLLYEWDSCATPFVPSFVDGISLAIAARLIQIDSLHRGRATVSREALAGFRLKRVMDYVSHNLHRPIYLAEFANVAGLSRMRFASQFRAATGFTPHEYILRQKIGRAQEILVASRESIISVALGLGFRSQTHFSTVFRKYVGGSPARWRSEQPKQSGYLSGTL
jgi:AraC family transcriptional regulator